MKWLFPLCQLFREMFPFEFRDRWWQDFEICGDKYTRFVLHWQPDTVLHRKKTEVTLWRANVNESEILIWHNDESMLLYLCQLFFNAFVGPPVEHKREGIRRWRFAHLQVSSPQIYQFSWICMLLVWYFSPVSSASEQRNMVTQSFI